MPYATFTPFKYPPFAAYAVAAPLNILPAREAYWVWVGLMEVLLLSNAAITFAVTRGRTWRWVAAAMWFAFTPYYIELYVGQWSFFVATLTFWASVLLLYRPPVVAMAPALVATMTKLIPAALAPVFLKMGGWRVLALAIAVGLLLNLPYFLWNPGTFGEFWRINIDVYFDDLQFRIFPFLTGDVGLARMMRTTWLTLFTDSPGSPQWLTFAWVAFVVAVTVAATIASPRAAVSSLVAMWLCVYFLSATGVWEHHYVMLLPGLVLLVALEPSQRAVALVVFVLIALPTPYVLFEGWFASGSAEFAPETGWPDWAALVYHAAKPIPVLWLWSMLCWAALQGRRGEVTGVATHPGGELRSSAAA